MADNSALPNGIGGPNPTLTTQALATRIAEKVFKRYFDGDPWVRIDSPVTATDRVVTKAVRTLNRNWSESLPIQQRC